MPARHLRGAEPHRVGDEPQRRPRREDELLLRLVLLQDVVLQRAAEARALDAGRLRVRDEHREDHRGRTVDRHRRRDRAEVDAAVEVFARRRACRPRHRTCRPRRARARRRSRGPSAWAGRTRSTARRCPAASSSWKRRLVSSAVPKPANMRIVQSFERYIDGVRPARVRVLARELAVVGPVDRLDRNTRHRREVGVARDAWLRTLPATRRAASRASGYKPDTCVGDAVVAAGRVAAVDRDRLAGHERRVGRHEERARPPRSPRAGRAGAACAPRGCASRTVFEARACRTRLRASASR